MPTVICGDKSTWHDWRDESLTKEIPSGVDVHRVSFSRVVDWTSLTSKMLSQVFSPFRALLDEEKVEGWARRLLFHLFYYVHPEPLISWIFLATKKALKCCNDELFDAVLTSGPPHMTHMVGLVLRRLRHIRWLVDLRSPWVDCELHGDRLGLSRRLDRIWEPLVLENADRLVTISSNWIGLISKRLSDGNESKINVVYNGYDPTDLTKSHQGQTGPQFRADTLHIHYNGTLQATMKPGTFFKALSELKKLDHQIEGSLRATFTGLMDPVADLATDLGLNEIVKDVGRLSHCESLQMSVNADVLLLILNEADETVNDQIPAKVYEYVALGKNILAMIPLGGELHQFLRGYDKGHIVGWNDSIGIVKALTVLMRKKRTGELTSSDPPKWIEQYSRQVQTRRLAKILEEMCSHAG